MQCFQAKLSIEARDIMSRTEDTEIQQTVNLVVRRYRSLLARLGRSAQLEPQLFGGRVLVSRCDHRQLSRYKHKLADLAGREDRFDRHHPTMLCYGVDDPVLNVGSKRGKVTTAGDEGGVAVLLIHRQDGIVGPPSVNVMLIFSQELVDVGGDPERLSIEIPLPLVNDHQARCGNIL